MRKTATLLGGLLVFLLLAGITLSAAAKTNGEVLASFDPNGQTQTLFYNEARTVYLGNLERRKAGVPPLRWNRELTLGARWFSWDSIENRPANWAGHQDTLGGWPGDRVLHYGYLGGAGNENAARGGYLLTPEGVVDLWMRSDGHRANLLDPGSREIGVGYYTRASDGATYIVQDFGNDADYPPLVIENEAPSTTSPQVGLYQYSGSGGGGLTAMGQATQMQVSNSACFGGAAWQTYQPETTWSLPAGNGWKTVYTKIRDAFGRTSTASDAIYLGANVDPASLDFKQTSQTTPSVTLYNLGYSGMNKAQFSLDWAMDDTNFTFLWGSASEASDSAARGGSAYRLDPAGGETSIWAYTSSFIPDVPMLAYFRLKTSSNASAGEVARVMVEANKVGQTISIKGTDFKAAGQYQEFVVPFTYHHNTDKPFLIFQVWRSGSATIYADAVTVFTTPQAYSGTYTWNVPGGHYRGQGVWVRYSDDAGHFSDYQAANSAQALSASPQQYSHMVAAGKTTPHSLIHIASCGSGWSVHSAPAWLQYQQTSSGLEIWANASQLTPKTYQDSLALDGSGESISIPLKLVVVDKIASDYLPILSNK